MYDLWVNGRAGAPDGKDIWNRLKNRGRWFLPSTGEWGALMANLGNSSSMRSALGLNGYKWTTTHCYEALIWSVSGELNSGAGGFEYVQVYRNGWEASPTVRLITTF